MQQRVELERLGDEVGRALLDRLDGVLHRAVAGDDDGDDVGIALERGVEHLPAVDAGQPQVGDEDVEGEVGEPLRAPASPLSACSTTKPWSASRSAIASRSGLLVVDDQQMFLAFRHLVEAGGILTPRVRAGQFDDCRPGL